MKQIIITAAILLLSMGCRKYESKGETTTSVSACQKMELRRINGKSFAPPIEEPEKKDFKVDKKKIIKDGEIKIRVNDLGKTKNLLDSIVKTYNSYYDKDNFTNNIFSQSYDLAIRIPSNNFEKFITDLEKGEGEIIYKYLNARDVTEEYIDLETRLSNKKNYLNKYNELLKKAISVKDILEIEENARVIQEEIESTEGKLKYLLDQVSYSTLKLEIFKETEIKKDANNEIKFFEKFKESLYKGWMGIIDFFLFLIKIWPIIIAVGILFLFRKKIKFLRKKKA